MSILMSGLERSNSCLACSVYSKGFWLVDAGIDAQTDSFELVQLDERDMVSSTSPVQRGSTGESIGRAFGEFYMGF